MPLSNCREPSDLLACETIAEGRILAACEAGQFDDLGAGGQRLTLRDNLRLEPCWQAFWCVLKGADLRPVWIEMLQEIRAEIRLFIVQMRVANSTLLVLNRVRRLNNSIATFNLFAPSMDFQRPSSFCIESWNAPGVLER